MTNKEATELLDKITSYCDFTDEYGDMIDSTPYYKAIDFAIKLLEQQPCEEDILKFYYVESLDDYWIGTRSDTMYYAEWDDLQGFVLMYSRYLPWGKHVVEPNSLWKEYTYPSEPKEIPFGKWIKGFLKKHGREQQSCDDCISRKAVLEQIDDWRKNEFLKVTNPLHYLRKRISSLPSVASQPKTESEE